MLENKIIIVGYSGHRMCWLTLIQLGKRFWLYREEIKKFNPYDLEYLGNEYNLDYIWEKIILIQLGNNDLRTSISKFLRSKSCTLINVIHPDSSISKSVSFGSGIFIARNVSINPFTKIEDDVIVNTSVTIDHECYVGYGSNISPGAVLSGNVKIGKKSFIGANSVIKEGVEIGDNVIIGAGSVVIKNVDNNKIVYGNPAK